MARKKKQTKKPIKVKINGKESPIKEEMVINNWNRAKQETAAAEETLKEEDFEWVLPKKETDDVPEYQSMQVSQHTENVKGSSIRKYIKNVTPKKAALIASISLAVVIGLGFGLGMLKLVANPENTATLTDTSAGAGQEGAAKGSKVTANLPELSVAVIQGGVFSTEEAAQQTTSDLSGRGLPAVSVAMDNQEFLFIGVAPDLETAKTWAEGRKAEGIDVYAKEISVSGAEMKVGSKEDAEWLAEGSSIFQILAKESAVAEVSGQMDGQSLEKAGGLLHKFGDKKLQQETSGELLKSINSAYGHLNAFKSSGDRADLVKAQQSLLEFLNIYTLAGQKSSV